MILDILNALMIRGRQKKQKTDLERGKREAATEEVGRWFRGQKRLFIARKTEAQDNSKDRE